MKKLFVLFIVLLFAAPALAVDWNFYGSARMETWWQENNLTDGSTAAGQNDSDLIWDLETSSRLGAKVKADAVRGHFEFGINESTVTSRRIYGTWDFGPATLKVGKDYTPVKQFISGQASNEDLGLLGVGTAYGSRHGQLALSFGGFEIALINPQNPGLKQAGDDRNEWLPKIEAAFGMGFDMFNFNILGGYQTLNEETLGNDDFDIQSWILAADAGVNFGPLYFKGSVSYAQNGGDAGWNIDGLVTDGATSTINNQGDDVDDVDTLMYALIAGFKFTDAMWIEAGWGYREDSYDAPGADDQDAWSAYVQLPIALAPGMWVIPEFSYYDFDKNSTTIDQDYQWWLGGKWQIDF